MSVFKRLRRILEAAIGDLVEKAKDPELELVRFVEEIELSLGEVRTELADARARRDHLAVQTAEQRRRVEEWMTKARTSAARDEDDIAKEALRRHHKADAEVKSGEERLAEAELALATLRRDEADLERKLSEVRLEQKRLAAKLRRAEIEKRASAALMGDVRDSDAVEGVRERIIDAQATGDARRELLTESEEAQFRALGKSQSLDEELAQLKRDLREKKGDLPPDEERA